MTIAGDRDFAPGSQEREDAAVGCAGTTAPVDTFIDGYGDYEGENDGNAANNANLDEEYFDGVLVDGDAVTDDVIHDNWSN
jgi:hypothetical protein